MSDWVILEGDCVERMQWILVLAGEVVLLLGIGVVLFLAMFWEDR